MGDHNQRASTDEALAEGTADREELDATTRLSSRPPPAADEAGPEEPDSYATLIDGGPRSRARPSAAPPSLAGPESSFRSDESRTTTAHATLLDEEIARTRVFLRIAIPLAITVLVSAMYIGSDPVAVRVVLAGMALIVVVCSWLAYHLRTDAGYTLTRIWVTSVSCILGALSGIYFFGVYSPAAVVIPFGVFFFGMSHSFRVTLVTYLACALGYAGLGVAMLFGALADRGIIAGSALGVGDRTILLGLVQVVFAATYVISRATRRANLQAVERHDVAVRRLAHREALLREVRQELDLAMQVGGVGRYTDVELGPFRLGTLIGRGAMGEVYEAMHVSSSELAAVKVLLPHVLTDPEQVRRFLREARFAASLDTPHVVKVIEVGGLEAVTPFIAMERLTGEDLADHLRRHRRLGARQVLKLARDVGTGLEAARKAGIVHRDIKPRNLFLAELPDGRRAWKVLDFGVSKLMSASGTLTQDRLVGTPSYMAPEQAKGAHVDHRADLYALGLIVYRALTGRPAFVGTDVADLLFKLLYTMPPRPAEVMPTLPPSVDAVLAIAIAKRPEDRFERASELVDALGDALTGRVDDAIVRRAEHALGELGWGQEHPAAPGRRG